MKQAILVPDVGSSNPVDVIEILVKVGQTIQVDDPIVTLESDKASMEVPSTLAGKVTAIHVKVGDKVTQDNELVTVDAAVEAEPASASKAAASEPASKAATPEATAMPAVASAPVAATKPEAPAVTAADDVYAGPAVRRLSRELGIDLHRIRGTGRGGRIQTDDLHAYIKSKMQSGDGAGFSLPQVPDVDHSKFGPISTQELSKIKKLSGANLQRNWIVVPHVTQFDEADITDMEAFRKQQSDILAKQGIKLTPLVLIMKAVVSALQAFPNFNASLSADGQSLILKQYYHIGVAVDTPNGLVVAVIRDVDKKGVIALSKELAAISEKARTKGLMPAEMQGSSFTISSLGGIGGTAFTPIVNLPDVAILGVSRSSIKPVYQDEQWVPRLMLPLSLSYDHRVIDGAEGARFTRYLADTLADLRRVLL